MENLILFFGFSSLVTSLPSSVVVSNLSKHIINTFELNNIHISADKSHQLSSHLLAPLLNTEGNISVQQVEAFLEDIKNAYVVSILTQFQNNHLPEEFMDITDDSSHGDEFHLLFEFTSKDVFKYFFNPKDNEMETFVSEEQFLNKFKRMGKHSRPKDADDSCIPEEIWSQLIINQGRNLFRLLSDNSEEIKSKEVIAALLLLSKVTNANADERMKVLFDLFDRDKTGELSLDELEHFFTTVFRVMTQLKKSNVSWDEAKRLASATAKQCFEDLDMNEQKKKFDFGMFKTWFIEHLNNNKQPELEEDSSNSNELFHASSMLHADARLVDMLNELKLLKLSYPKVVEALSSVANKEKLISEADFTTAFVNLSEGILNENLASKAAELLYEDYITDEVHKQKGVLLSELVACLSVFCIDVSTIESAGLMFSLLTNGKDFITLEDIQSYFAAKYKTVFLFNPEASQLLRGITEKELASIAGEEFFKAMNLELNAKLNQEQLITFHQQKHQVSSGKERGEMRMWEVYKDFYTLNHIKRVLKLDEMYLDDVVNYCSRNTDLPDGSISEQQFVRVFVDLIAEHNKSAPMTRSIIMLRVLFRMLIDDEDNSSSGVSVSSVAAVMSLFCKTDEDLQHSIDSVFKTKTISFQEMKSYLSVIFRFLYESNSFIRTKTNANNFTPKQLADFTAKSIFRKAHINQDGKFSLNDFKHWVARQREEEEVSKVKCEVSVCDKSQEKRFRVKDIMEITKLNKIQFQKIVDYILSKVASGSELSYKKLYRLLRNIRLQIDDNKSERLDWHIKVFSKKLVNLAHAEESDDDRQLSKDDDSSADGSKDEEICGDYEVARVEDILISLSLFCSSDNDVAKCKTIFQIIDKNGDLFLTADEILHFLTIIFATMHEFDHVFKSRKEIRKLAEETAKDIFEKVDLNHDGKLSFDEFTKWYLFEKDSQEVKSTLKNAFLALKIELKLTNQQLDLENVNKFKDLVHDNDVLSLAKVLSASESIKLDLEKFAGIGVIFINNSSDIDVLIMLTLMYLLCFDFTSESEMNEAEILFQLYDSQKDGVLTSDKLLKMKSNFEKIFSLVKADVPLDSIFDQTNKRDLIFTDFLGIYKKLITSHDLNPTVSTTKLSLTSLEEITNSLGFGKIQTKDMLVILNNSCISLSGKRILDLDRFTSAMASIHQKDLYNTFIREEDERIIEWAAELFSIFHPHKLDDGMLRVLSFEEVASGLSLFTFSSTKYKLKHSFYSYSTRKKRFLTRIQMEMYLGSLFSVLHPTAASLEQLVHQTMIELGINDDEIYFKDFWVWCCNGGRFTDI